MTLRKSTNKPFFIQKGEVLTPDLILDEQALVIEGTNGITVLTGCAHAGMANDLTQVKMLWPHKEIYGLMGGFHLLNARVERLQKTTQDMNAGTIFVL